MQANSAERRRWNDPYWTSVWPNREELTSAVTTFLLDHLEPSPTDRILEVGPGGGTATFEIAARVSEIVGVDVSRPLVDLARQRAADRGAANVSFTVADAQEDDIGGAPFDAVASQFGVMFFDQPVRAFANLRSHVAEGGRLAFVCWDQPERNPWFVGAAAARFLPTPPGGPGAQPTGPFALADRQRTISILADAGWRDVDDHPYELAVTVGRQCIIDDAQLGFLGVPVEHLEAARQAVDDALAPLARPDGRYVAPLSFRVVTART
jgi:SAM-dependent methyltransferase